MKDDLRHIIESLLFVSDSPLSLRRIQDILDLRNTEPIREALDYLKEEYEARKGGFYLSEVAGGYQLRTRPEHREWIKRMLQNRPARLTRASLETLAIIAYKQPVIRSDIEYIRGVDCGGVLRILLERKLIRVLGRREIPGRPMIYATTHRFLELFDLKDLKDLPTPKEMEAMGRNHTEPSDLPGGEKVEGAGTEGMWAGMYPPPEIEDLVEEAVSEAKPAVRRRSFRKKRPVFRRINARKGRIKRVFGRTNRKKRLRRYLRPSARISR